MARVHRIGQTRHVEVVRFVAKGSIEERMLLLQESKGALAKGATMELTQIEEQHAVTVDCVSLLLIE